MKKFIVIVAGSVMASAPVFADGTIADPTTVVTTATAIAVSVTTVALGLLGWAVGSKLVRKYIK